jgi:FtsH-binding integral membrane protein
MKQFDLAYPIAADAQPEHRAQFIARTYGHVAGAVMAFIVVEYIFLHSIVAELMIRFLGIGRLSWLVVLGLFMGASWFAHRLAENPGSAGRQYAGLGIFIVAEALVFLPLILIATTLANDLLPLAAGITGMLFLGLTTVAFTTKKDFSFLGTALKIGGFVAMGLIGASLLVGFEMGLLFAGGMVVFASAAILYETSQIMHKYGTNQHVAASLGLFASVMLLFYYVLMILMGSRRD